ncbi:MAG TPA: endonuclease, partial [Kiloniellales bacterium]|nr:endonuclease [Kiloniellales bacterium]
AGQALETRLLLERLFDAEPEALIAVCGDFNAEERQSPLRTIRADPEDTGNPELAGRALWSLDGRVPAGQRYSVLHGGRPEMLDHLLVSPALLAGALEVAVHNRDLVDELQEGGPESHHAPVVASFALA